jgi:predicted ATP-grasp superfamily ATP-dependent carboligase
VVAPETDGLLQRCPAWVGTTRWRGSTADALAITSSKQQTLARLAAHGLCTPLDAWAHHDARRWVVKPDVGAGAVDTVVLDDRTAAEALAARRAAAGEAVTLQPWVEGEAMSVSLLCGAPEPADVLSLNRQHLTLDTAGRVRFAGVQRVCTDPADPRWPALQALADTLVRALPGLRGFIGIDLVWHARHGPVPIEVNARVSCAYVGLSAALGRNLAGETLARCHAGATDALA